MRLIKMFSLAALAAVAAMAFVGASSATAEPTALCRVHTELGCPAGQVYTGHVEGLSTHALLEASGIKILCTHSIILGEALGLANPGPLIGHVSLLDFSGCTPCSPTVIDKVGTLKLLKTALNLGQIEAEGFEVLINCLGVHCIYGGVAKNVHAIGSDNTKVPPTLALTVATKTELKKLAGSIFCPGASLWTATYSIVLPDPIYITN